MCFSKIHDTASAGSSRAARGFTLIELLVAIGVIGILSTVLIAGAGAAREAAHRTAVTANARSLIMAYLATPLENNEFYMVGYGDAGETIHPPQGPPISSSSEEAKRYPWRIAPYLNDHVETLYVGKHAAFYKHHASKNAYTTSLHPSFGMNSVFVGGHRDGRKHDPGYTPGGRGGDGSTFPRDFWVLQPGDAYNPSNLIVFATSRYSPPEGYSDYVGFYRLNAPKSPASPTWGGYRPEIPASLGFVSLEYGGKAVVAHLDGNVRLLDETELRDMRRWSNQAAMYNDPNFADWDRQQ